MSQAPPPSNYPNYPNYAAPGAAQPAQTNGLGLAGFITSLIGFLTCGFVSPIGLLLSLIGLAKRPRGFAVAGTIIGLAGTIFLAISGFAIVVGMLGLKKAVETGLEMAATQATARQAYEVIDKQRQANDALPSDAEGNQLIQSYTDNWGMALKYERAGETFSLVSAGKDKQFGTADDMRFSESDLQAYATTQSTTDEAEMTEDEEMVEEDVGAGDTTTDDAAIDDAATDGENP